MRFSCSQYVQMPRPTMITVEHYRKRIEMIAECFERQFAGGVFPFFVPPGWLGIVEEVLSQVDLRLKGETRDAAFVWTDIDEKHGRLRMSFSAEIPGDEAFEDWAQDLVCAAERKSEHLCIYCAAAVPEDVWPRHSRVLFVCPEHAVAQSSLLEYQGSF